MNPHSRSLIATRERIVRVESYTTEGREVFMASPLIQDAVVYNLLIIGEASKHLSPTFRQAHPDIDWKAIVGFRNIAAHDVVTLDSIIIWGIVDDNLPVLKEAVNEELRNMEDVSDEPTKFE